MTRVHRVYLTDGYADRAQGERAKIEERMRAVRARLWSDVDDKAEINAELEQLEQELRALDQRRGAA